MEGDSASAPIAEICTRLSTPAAAAALATVLGPR